MKATSKLGRKEVRQMLYAVVAVFLCFIGPTYLAAVMSKIIPSTFAMTLGFASFLVGVILILKIVKE
ncbi:MAG: hypothetical protein WCC63_01485 [Candidatus Bathyarchaeia archaeon]